MKVLLKCVHEAVLRIQTEPHGPQDDGVVWTQVHEGLHQLLQVRMRVHHVCSHDVVVVAGVARESLLQLLPPAELGHKRLVSAESSGVTVHVVSQITQDIRQVRGRHLCTCRWRTTLRYAFTNIPTNKTKECYIVYLICTTFM